MVRTTCSITSRGSKNWLSRPDEVDRVLEGRFGDGEDEFDGDFGERPEAWYEEDEAVVTST